MLEIYREEYSDLLAGKKAAEGRKLTARGAAAAAQRARRSLPRRRRPRRLTCSPPTHTHARARPSLIRTRARR